LYHPKGKKATEFGQFLHARTLSFTHPLTGETLNFQVEPPKEFAEFIQLNKGHFED
jgi:pseudouridylate synthase